MVNCICGTCKKNDKIYYNNIVLELLCKRCSGTSEIIFENNIMKEKEDVINKPNHYHDNGIDPISIGEMLFTKEEMNGFYKMNMLKYWYRAGKKDNNSKEQDLKKYEFYKKKLGENN